MPLPYNSIANQPQGLGIITIGGVTYVVNALDGATKSDNRIIGRQDENGDRADFMEREGSDPVVIELELQKAALTTPAPVSGTIFTYDFFQIGKEEFFIVVDAVVERTKDKMTVFKVRAVYSALPPALLSVELEMDYADTVHRERSTASWVIPAGVTATSVQVWDNSDLQIQNTVDTLVDTVTPPTATSFFTDDYFALQFFPGDELPTVAVRYQASNGDWSPFAYINFTMPSVTGVYTFPQTS